MWLSLIFISLFYGITSNTLPLYQPYFKYNIFQSFILDDELCYSSFFEPDTFSGEWILGNTTLSTKVPLLEATSIKQKGLWNFINIDFITPVGDTLNKIILNATSIGSNVFYENSYTAAYIYFNKPVKVFTLFKKTTSHTLLNTTNLHTQNLIIESQGVLDKATIKFTKNSIIYGNKNFKLGALYWKDSALYYGIKGNITKENVSLNVDIPLNAIQHPFYDIRIRISPLNFYIKKDLKYNIKTNQSTITKQANLTICTEYLHAKLWMTSLENVDTMYGTLFMISPSRSLSSGFTITKTTKNTNTSLVLSSEQSFYNDELKLSILFQFLNMKYLHYGVEIMLFKNLVLRSIRFENQDFIGIFVRLIN